MTTTDDNDDGQDQNLTSNPSEDTRVDIPEDPNAPRPNENHPSQSQLQGISKNSPIQSIPLSLALYLNIFWESPRFFYLYCVIVIIPQTGKGSIYHWPFLFLCHCWTANGSYHLFYALSIFYCGIIQVDKHCVNSD